MVCDNVIAYEVVLASGEVIEVTNTSHRDLFIALKGGGSNFGIVTRVDLPTFEQGGMWGGAIFYPNGSYPSLINAFVDFSKSTTPDEKATIIVAATYVSAEGPISGEIGVSNIYYSTPTPNPPSLQPFSAIQPQLMSTLRNDSLLGFSDEQSAFNANGARQWFFTTSFKIEKQFMLDIHGFFSETVESLKTQPGFVISMVFHPITPQIIQSSLNKGGNSLGMRVSDGPFVVCLVNTVHSNAASDDLVSAGALKLIKQIEDLSAERKLVSRYRFYNYGYKSQQIIEGYGRENVAKMKAVSERYDPSGFFQTIVTGGFKVSAVKL